MYKAATAKTRTALDGFSAGEMMGRKVAQLLPGFDPVDADHRNEGAGACSSPKTARFTS